MDVVELPASPEVLARVELSQNGLDMLCAAGGLLNPRCKKQPAAVFMCNGFLWPACEGHRDRMRWALSMTPGRPTVD